MAKDNQNFFADDLDYDVEQRHRSARDEFSVSAQSSATARTAGLVAVSTGLAIILLSFFFLVRSFWIFTHPHFDFNLPKLNNFSIFYDNGSDAVPTKMPPNSGSNQVPNPIPSLPNVSDTQILNFSNQIAEKHNVLASKMTQQELVNLGQGMCSSFHRHFLWIDHQSSRTEVLDSFVIAMYAKYPKETGIHQFGKILLDASVTNLCPEYKDVK